MTANAKNTQWVWNVDAVDIDDATGEIRRLEKQVRMLLIQPLQISYRDGTAWGTSEQGRSQNVKYGACMYIHALEGGCSKVGSQHVSTIVKML